MKRHFHHTFFLFAIGLLLFSCKSYKYHLMFQIDEDQDMSYLSTDILVSERNYTIQPNDLLDMRVYTNDGERIIDPNNELQTRQNQNRDEEEKPEFLVMEDGKVKLPMVGMVDLTGMKINEAEEYLEKKYNEYYSDAYVKLKYLNKRVIVLGAPGGQVIPLQNENTSVVEVVAMAGGIDEGGKAFNLRLIRGDLHHPEVFVIDLSTINGVKASMMNVLPGDIIYIEPNRKVITEGAKDFMTVFAIFVNAVTLVALIVSLNK